MRHITYSRIAMARAQPRSTTIRNGMANDDDTGNGREGQ